MSAGIHSSGFKKLVIISLSKIEDVEKENPMRRFPIGLAFLGAIVGSQLGIASPAQASGTGLILANSELLALFQIVASQNECFTYTYDLNGNRLTKNDLTYGATGTWGTSLYGCFNWHS